MDQGNDDYNGLKGIRAAIQVTELNLKTEDNNEENEKIDQDEEIKITTDTDKELNINELEFLKAVKKTSEFFLDNKPHRTRILSHLDADGITSASIILKTMNRLNILYNLSITQTLTNTILNLSNKDNSDMIIITDLGSSQISEIAKIIKNKKIILLDHHDPEDVGLTQSVHYNDNVIVLNPHFFGIDGNRDISGSGVSYFFSYFLNKRNKDLAHIAFVGLMGDFQEKNEDFSYLNRMILKHALETGKIKITKNLKFYGAYSRPIHKLLEYSTEPYLPGITGSESKSIQFLKTLDIHPKKESGEWKKLNDLTEKEIQKLAVSLIMLLMNDEKTNPEEIIGSIYELTDEDEDSPLRDVREFATLLNACGRLNRSSIGIGVCLNDPKAKTQAKSLILDYKKEIIKYIQWFRDNKDFEDNIIKGENYIIINAENNIRYTMIGTIASILSNSNEIPEDCVIVSIAQIPEENKTKISLRYKGNRDIDLKKIIDNIIKKLNHGESGGHKSAAGAFIDTDYEKEFIEITKKELKEYFLKTI